MSTNIPYKTTDYLVEGFITPEVKVSEGFDSVGAHFPAAWLPLVRFNQEFEIHVVISRGTPVACVGNSVVPAGYRFEYEAVKAGGAATILYSAEDVRNGIKNYAGTLVTAGEAVVQSLIDADVEVSFFAGIANYDIFEFQGSIDNPTKYKRYNFNPQPTVSFKMDYHFEYPVVGSTAQVNAAPLPGVAAFVGKGIKPGQFVTYDKASRFVVAAADFTQGTGPVEAIVGQVSQVVAYRDPDTLEVVQAVNYLDKVLAPENHTGRILNDLPNVRNGGITQKLAYANAYGVVRFGLQTR